VSNSNSATLDPPFFFFSLSHSSRVILPKVQLLQQSSRSNNTANPARHGRLLGCPGLGQAGRRRGLAASRARAARLAGQGRGGRSRTAAAAGGGGAGGRGRGRAAHGGGDGDAVGGAELAGVGDGRALVLRVAAAWLGQAAGNVVDEGLIGADALDVAVVAVADARLEEACCAFLLEIG